MTTLNASAARTELSLELANSILSAALEKARALEVLVNVAVVDAGPNLKAFFRMDGALLASIDVAMKKARTARLCEMESGAVGELSQPGGPWYGIELSNGGLITFAGGVPLRFPGGPVIGAIGVSGSTVENDRAVALAGARALLVYEGHEPAALTEGHYLRDGSPMAL